MQSAPQLYLISPPAITLSDFAEALEEALSVATHSHSTPSLTLPPQGGGNNCVGAFQLRLKDASDAEIEAAIQTLSPICRKAGVAFIINDRPDLCAKYKLDGVHVGQEDLKSMDPRLRGDDAIKTIRNIVGIEAIIGVTCHASKHLAMEAGEAGADYVAFGAFYETTSKPKEKLEKWGTPTPEILTWWQEFMTLPCVAIGGITPANAKPLVDAGADFIAVLSAVWNHPEDAKKAVEEFNEVMK